MEAESSAAAAPPERELTEALLGLSWPLPRTVEDADAALTRLEEVKSVLTRLEQQSAGHEAWWAGQVDGLATQSGFVLEWWRPVLRDPDLDWTLNHQAHLTADLATLASAGARLLDQIEPRSAEEAAEAAHARRAVQEKRWGPAAVPGLAPSGPRPGVSGPRPQPPAEVFGDAVPAAHARAAQPMAPPPSTPIDELNAPQFRPAPPTQPADASAPAPADDPNAPQFPSTPPTPAPFDLDAPPVAAPPSIPTQGSTAPTSGAGLPPVAAPSSIPAQGLSAPLPNTGLPPAAESISEPISEPAQASAVRPFAPIPVPVAPEAPMPAARHRRPAYDFDDPQGSDAPHSAVHPQGGPPPRSPVVPGPGFGGPAHQGRVLTHGGAHRPTEYGSGPFGFAGEEDDDPDSLVPTGLRRHQRRLLIQTGAIVGAIGVLCWWAVYTLSSPSPHTSAAGDATHSASESATDRSTVAAGGLSAPHSTSTTPGQASDSAPASPAPSTVSSAAPDATTVSSVRVTLLGGSSAVPQIVALITVDTAGTGQVTVTGSYYGASGAHEVAAETERWTLAGKTTYQYSVPIANSAYCGTEFHFTASAGGRTDAEETAPGC